MLRIDCKIQYLYAHVYIIGWFVLQRWEITGIPSGWPWWIQQSRWIRWNRMWIERQTTVYPVQINRTIRGISFLLSIWSFPPLIHTTCIHFFPIHCAMNYIPSRITMNRVWISLLRINYASIVVEIQKEKKYLFFFLFHCKIVQRGLRHVPRWFSCALEWFWSILITQKRVVFQHFRMYTQLLYT